MPVEEKKKKRKKCFVQRKRNAERERRKIFGERKYVFLRKRRRNVVKEKKENIWRCQLYSLWRRRKGGKYLEMENS